MTQSGTGAADLRVPLSFNQEFLCLFDPGDGTGPFGPRFHVVGGWRLTGTVEPSALSAALADVVQRHEPLRTEIVRGAEGAGHQRVHPPSRPTLQIRTCPGVAPAEREQLAQALVREIEASTLPVEELPHLRAVLLQFDEDDAALVLQAHHTVTDGWSMQIIMRDLAACYVARRDGTPADLPAMRPYRDFVRWEQQAAGGEPVVGAQKYWRKTLDGARLTGLPTDHSRSAGLPAVTAAYRFSLDTEVMAGVSALAARTRVSPVMVLTAAYYRLVHELTGATDIVVSTHTPGRTNPDFDDTIGSFFNFLPLRIDLAQCPDAMTLLRHTRDTCLGAYAHDIPTIPLFQAAPELMANAMLDRTAPVTFQVMQLPGNSAHPDVQTHSGFAYRQIPWEPRSEPVVSQIPDGALWTINFEPTGAAMGNLMYRTDRFTEQTITAMVRDYQRILTALLTETRLRQAA